MDRLGLLTVAIETLVADAVKEAKPLANTVTFGGLGIWLFGIGQAIVVWLAYLKIWPKLREMAISDRSRQIDQMRQDLATLTRRDIQREAQSRAVTIRLQQLEFVLRMVTDELEQVSPQNAMVSRARALFADMFPLPTSDPLLDDEMHKLDETP